MIAVFALPLAPLRGLTQAAPQQTPNSTQDPSLEGMTLYTSDGKAIGKVIAMGMDEDDKPVLVAEIERQLGFGLMAVAVPPEMFVRKGDRIELTITEAEVNSRLRQ